MIISHKFKFIFVKTAKTAGTSIEVFLSPLCAPDDILTPFSEPEDGHIPRNYRGLFNPFPDILTWMRVNRGNKKIGAQDTINSFLTFQKYFRHIPAWQIKKRLRRDVWENYYKFCVERNPWDKVVSGWNWYNIKYRKNLTLDQYLNVFANKIHSLIRGVGTFPFNYVNYTDPINGNLLVDKVIRYEHLDEELNLILLQLGIPIEFPSHVRAKSGFRKDNGYREVYSQSQLQVVGDLFREEIELHEYSF